MSQLVDEVRRLEYEAQDNAKTAVDFLQKNEALRAENDRLRLRLTAIKGERDDTQQCAAEYFKSMAFIHERYPNEDRDLPTCIKELFARIDELRAANNEQDAKSDAIIEKLRVEMLHLREEYTNRGAIIQDFAKREHEHQQKIAELEKILQDVEGLGSLTAATALQWKDNYERQMAVNARQRSRIGRMRLSLKRIAEYDFASLQSLRSEASSAIFDDDRAAVKPITNILAQEAP
jgi:regulator of replication initiation timing